MKLLDLEHIIIPVNIAKVKQEWMAVFNVPNDNWPDIQEGLEALNSDDIPHTAKVFLLNNMPYSVVTILLEHGK